MKHGLSSTAPGVRGFVGVGSGGGARASLYPRLISGTPLACGAAGRLH